MHPLAQGFTLQHERIMAVLDRALGEAAAGRAGASTEQVHLLAGQLALHLDAEESVALPVVARSSAVAATVAATLRKEHVVLRQLLAAVEIEAEAGRLASLQANLRELAAELRLHMAKEERQVFPLLESSMELPADLMASG